MKLESFEKQTDRRGTANPSGNLNRVVSWRTTWHDIRKAFCRDVRNQKFFMLNRIKSNQIIKTIFN